MFTRISHPQSVVLANARVPLLCSTILNPTRS